MVLHCNSMYFEKVMYAQILNLMVTEIIFMASLLVQLAARFMTVLLHIPQL